MGVLQTMPTLFQHLDPVMDAFWMLTPARQIGGMGGVGPIALSDILEYLKWQEITNMDEQRRWVRMIRALDNVFVTHSNKKE